MAPKQHPPAPSRRGDGAALAFDPDLRIPPLQHPLPLVPARRPSPLEPNARVPAPAHHPTATLTSRTKALDAATPLGADGDRAARAGDPRRAANPADRPEAEGVRKKQKVDIFQLPQPTAKARTHKPPPFKPVPVLNELHEPPPSAGLFPPITPTGLSDIEPGATRPEPAAASPGPATPGRPPRTHDGASASPPRSGVKPKAKRKCLRGRLKWTDAETDDLLKGVGIYGVGKWKKILTHPDFAFHPDRTMVDLKDRYRTCRMNEEKAIERQAADDEPASRPSDGRASIADGHAEASSATPSRPASDGGRSARNGSSHSEPLFNITTFSAYEESLQSPKPRKAGGAHPWTSDEDANLSRGYQKYGFQWTAITKDAEFGLGHRTGAQVRDRFRMKYPIVYQSSVPLPLPDAAKRPPRPATARRSSSQDPSQLTFIMHDADPPAAAPRARPMRPAIQPPPHAVPSLSSQGSSPGTPAVLLPDRFSGLNVQPLPAPAPPATASEEEDDDDDESDAAAAGLGGPEAADPEEARHLSILGLLNEADDGRSRLPAFKYALDDWDTAGAGTGAGGGAGGVTLPPLLSWEEMTNKPMFELE